MSLMGSVVTLYILCWLLAASSSTSFSRDPQKSRPDSQLNKEAPLCATCSNGSTSLPSTETSQRNVTNSPPHLNGTSRNPQSHEADDVNKSQITVLNHTVNNGIPSPNNKINDSISQLNNSFMQNPSPQDTSPSAKPNDSSPGPEVTSAPLSHTDIDINEPEKASPGVPSNAAVATTPAHTKGTTLTTATAASTTSSISKSNSTSYSTSATSPTTSLMLTTKSTSTHASTNIAPTPSSVKTTISTISSPKTTGSTPMEPETTMTTTTIITTTTTTTTTSTASSTTSPTISPTTPTPTLAATATITAFVSTNPSSTAQYISPVVVAAGRDLARQLVDRASLLAILLFGLLFFFVVVAVFVTQAYESYRRKDYTQVDYLINGMYTDSGV